MLKRGEVAEFGRWIKFTPEGHVGYAERSRSGSDYIGGSSRRRIGLSSNSRKSGSDAPSWRKSVNLLDGKMGRKYEWWRRGHEPHEGY